MDFPIITNLQQVKDAIQGNKYFRIIDTGEYSLVTYTVQDVDTFPSPYEDGISSDEKLRRMILRECRGLLFDTNGNIIRRPLNKFFNYGQMEMEDFDINTDHVYVDKLDGSMIVPFYVNGILQWGTKAGHSDVSRKVDQFVLHNNHYAYFAKHWLDQGYNPIFEYCAPDNQIVVRYEERKMTLLEVRHIQTGKYLGLKEAKEAADDFGIPFVETHGTVTNMDNFLEFVQNLKGQEGFIIRANDGNGMRLKFKAEEYLALHRVVSDASSETVVMEAIMTDTIDDMLGQLPKDIKAKVEKFHHNVMDYVLAKTEQVHEECQKMKEQFETQKEIAAYVNQHHKDEASMYFRFLKTDVEELVDCYWKVYYTSLNAMKKIDDNRHLIGGFSLD